MEENNKSRSVLGKITKPFASFINAIKLLYTDTPPSVVNLTIGDLGEVNTYSYDEHRLIPVNRGEDGKFRVVLGDGIASLYYRTVEAYDFKPFSDVLNSALSVVIEGGGDYFLKNRRIRFHGLLFFQKLDTRPKSSSKPTTYGVFVKTVYQRRDARLQQAIIHIADVTMPSSIYYPKGPDLDIHWQGEKDAKHQLVNPDDTYKLESIGPTAYEDKLFVANYTNGKRFIQLYI